MERAAPWRGWGYWEFRGGELGELFGCWVRVVVRGYVTSWVG